MGEISGAARNKGAFDLFVCSTLPVSVLVVDSFAPTCFYSVFCLTMLPVLFQSFLFNSFLFALMVPAACLSSLHPFFSIRSFCPRYSLFLWWVLSREVVPHVAPQCTPAHPRFRLLDCDWFDCSVTMRNPEVFINPTLHQHSRLAAVLSVYLDKTGNRAAVSPVWHHTAWNVSLSR